jgi:nitrate/nitrite-specific signal transduction histidine kinase
LWVTWQLEGGAAAVNEAGRMRMQTWRMAQTLARADAQQIGSGWLAQFDQSVNVLRTGDPARPLLVPHDALSQQAFAAVQRDWLDAQGQVDRLACDRVPNSLRRSRPMPSWPASTPSSRRSSTTCPD